jgi:protein O-GlcNAc transferase
MPLPLQVRVVEFNASTPFRQQLETMASTTVLVSVHTSNLANAQFMQPGSAVFEIIQRNWFWHGLDKSFQASRRSACMPRYAVTKGGMGKCPCRASVWTPTACQRAAFHSPPQVQTGMMGDIHHYAWRARRRNETKYIVERDSARFGDWEPLQCNTEECVEVRVDIPLLGTAAPCCFVPSAPQFGRFTA